MAFSSVRDPFRLIVEGLPDAAFLLDPAGLVLSWNLGAERTLGYVADEVVGLSFARLYPPGDVAVRKPCQDLRSALRDRQFKETGLRVRKDGSTFQASSIVTALYDRGEHLGYSAFIRDISGPRQQAEPDNVRHAAAEQHRAADLLRAVADETTDAIFVKDRAGKYLFFNEAAARFVGKPAESVIGIDDRSLFTPEDARRVMERDRRIMESGVAETAEENLSAAGMTRTYLATKSPFRDDDGNVIGLIAISRDITDRKRVEEKLHLFRTLIDEATDGGDRTRPGNGLWDRQDVWREHRCRKRSRCGDHLQRSSSRLGGTRLHPEDGGCTDRSPGDRDHTPRRGRESGSCSCEACFTVTGLHDSGGRTGRRGRANRQPPSA